MLAPGLSLGRTRIVSVAMQAATEVRLLVKPGGASKGCAYVEFGSKEDATAAIAQHDQELWHGKHILVAPSAPPGKRQKGKQVRGEGSAKPLAQKGKSARHRGSGQNGFDQTDDRAAEQPHQRVGAAAMLPRAVTKKAGQAGPTPPAASNAAFKNMLGL